MSRKFQRRNTYHEKNFLQNTFRTWLYSYINISPSPSTPDTTTVSLTQTQPSPLCITPYFDDFPFDI